MIDLDRLIAELVAIRANLGENAQVRIVTLDRQNPQINGVDVHTFRDAEGDTPVVYITPAW